MTASVPLLTVTDLTRTYATGGGEVPVLTSVSLKLDAGDSLAIVGPSGSGKSTLLQIIGTLDRANSGSIALDGRDLGALNEEELAAVRNTRIGFVFQSHYLLPQCTAWENVLVPTLANVGQASRLSSNSPAPSEDNKAAQKKAEARTTTEGSSSEPDVAAGESTSTGRDDSSRTTGGLKTGGTPVLHPQAGSPSYADRAERLLKRVGLGDRMTHFPGQLSGGERQRVAVVRALINQPALLLADEPTGALDQSSAESLGQLLVELNREEGVTLVVVTHSMELAKRMKRVMRLEEGRLKEER